MSHGWRGSFTKSRSWREKDRLDIGVLRRLAAPPGEAG
jgi:hypothetical protein